MGRGKANIKVIRAPIRTYAWDAPGRYPVFLTGWGGRLYPYTMEDKLLHAPVDREYNQVVLENDYIQVIVLPELGGHLWRAYDKVSGQEMFYNNHTVKVALISMRGAWWASGIEWNFPRGHSVSTVSPVDYRVFENEDGSVSVAVGDIDRISRMKWTVKITVEPDRTGFRVDTVLSNPTPYPHRYMYWENCAVHANEGLQYISPAKSAWTWTGSRSFPINDGVDQSWYKAHPYAIDFFTLSDGQDYFGYFDHDRNFGAVHVADSQIMPGKKFFTWGTDEHGEIWTRNLSDNDGAYIELQCGLGYTQAEYRFFPPQQSIRWDEAWYPVGDLGAFTYANRDAALALSDMLDGPGHGDKVDVALVTATDVTGACLKVTDGRTPLLDEEELSFRAGRPRRWTLDVPARARELKVEFCAAGRRILEYSTGDRENVKEIDVGDPRRTARPGPDASAEANIKAAVAAIKNLDFGLALELVDVALEKKPGCSAAHYWKGNILFIQFRYDEAAGELAKVAARSEYYGVAQELLAEIHRYAGRFDEAMRVAARLAGNKDGRLPGNLVAAKAAMCAKDFSRAAENLASAAASPEVAPEFVALHSVALRKAGRSEEAVEAARRALAIDPLNHLALNELEIAGAGAGRDAVMHGAEENYIELASYYEDVNCFQEAAAILEYFRTHVSTDSTAMLYYHLGWCNRVLGHAAESDSLWRRAAGSNPDYVFAFRREDLLALEAALEKNPRDSLAHYLVGNLYAWRFRYGDAVSQWRRAKRNGLGRYAVLLRNMGQIQLKVFNNAPLARKRYEAAIEAAPGDEELYFEADDAYAKSRKIDERIAMLERGASALPESQKVHKLLAQSYYFAGRYDDAIRVLSSMSFDRWECDRFAYKVYENSWFEKGRELFHERDYQAALEALKRSMEYPENLKTGKPAFPRHAAQHYLSGLAYKALGRCADAEAVWRQGAGEKHHNWDGGVCAEGYYKGLCLAKIGRRDDADRIWRRMTGGLTRKELRPPASNEFVIGLGYQGLEEWDKALDHFEKALSYDRTNRSFKYHRNLARRRRQAGG